MKRYILLMLLLGASLKAQIGGDKTLDLSAGIEKNGFAGRIGLAFFLDEGKFIRLGGQFNTEKFTDDDIPVYVYQANLEYYKSLFSQYNRNWVIYLGAGALAGYEEINKGKEFLPDNRQILAKNNFIYGGHLGVEIDRYLFESGRSMFSLFINARENYYFNSDLGKLQFNITGGIRYSW